MAPARKIPGYILIFIAMTLHIPVQSQLHADQIVTETRIYKTIGRSELELYIFRPAERDNQEKLAAIVFFHGGAWAGGHAWQFKPQCGYLARYGMVAITVEYRVRKRDGATPLDCVADAKSAIRWVRAHADEYGIDKNRIAAGGGSSGGHLAACTALSTGFEEEDEDLSISSVPDALVLFNAVLDVPEVVHQLPKKVQKVMENRAKEISPAHNVSAGAPPTIILHGTADSSIPFGQATHFCEEMHKYGNRCEVVPFEGRGHGFFNFEKGENPDFDVTMAATVNFLTSLGFIRGESGFTK